MLLTVYNLLTLYLLAGVYCLEPENQAVVTEVRDKIQELIDKDKSLIGGFVRLAFHDCVGDGNCDGCINHTLSDNKGLKIYTNHLDRLFDKRLSRADIYALAGITACENAAVNFNAEFKVGRGDCRSSPDEDDKSEVFPTTDFTLDQSVKYFRDNFGMDKKQTVALLGAHTLGRARIENSGYEGKWVRGGKCENELDNKFFKQLIKGPWTQVKLLNGKTQWQRKPFPLNDPKDRPSAVMMLNSDMALAYDIYEAGKNNCTKKTQKGTKVTVTCPPFDNDIVDGYARNNDEWLKDFTIAFLMMINKNNNDLKDLSELPQGPTSTPKPKRRKGRRGDSLDELEEGMEERLDTIIEDIQAIKSDFE